MAGGGGRDIRGSLRYSLDGPWQRLKKYVEVSSILNLVATVTQQIGTTNYSVYSFPLNVKNFCPAEFNTLYHRDLRQAIFVKDDHHYLNVPRVGTYAVYDTLDCALRCLSNPSCFSINLAASKGADGKLWCELLSSEKNSNPGEYKRNQSSHHFSIKVSLLFSIHTPPPPPPSAG